MPLPNKPAKTAKARKPAPRILCVLSRKRSLYSTRRLVQAAKSQGHRAFVFDTLRCNVALEADGPAIYYGTKRLPTADAAIPRIGASITAYGLAVVRQFELLGTPVLNTAAAIAGSRDKLRCLQELALHGIATPNTLMAHRRTSVPALVERVGGLPVIVKLVQGTQGIGVMLASTMEEAETLLNTFWDLGHDILLQEFIQESEGRDVRAFVIGGEVVAAMRRQARAGEFRSNIHRGGEGSPVTLEPDFAHAAVEAARVVGLEVAGVDMLESDRGPLVIEVNSSPGFEGIEAATKVDVAGAMIRHAVGLAERKRAAH